MQFQKDQSGKAAGAGRAIVQACGEDVVIATFGTPDFPVFSLFGSVIFGRIVGFRRLFADFPIFPPPFTGICRHV